MKDTRMLLNDILEAIHTIESFKVSSYAAFLADEKTQDAINIVLIFR